MSRQYEFTFRGPGGRELKARGYGNVLSTAERSARAHLAEEHEVADARKWYSVAHRFVPKSERKP